jgi:hypothetical protein
VKVYVYPGDRTGCGSYRLIWPAEAVAAHCPDWDVVIIPPEIRSVQARLDRNGHVVQEDFPADADLIILQRPTMRFLPDLVPLLRARGVAVIVDMDDDLAHIHPRNPAFATLAKTLYMPHPKLKNRRIPIPNTHSPQNAARACADATMVTTTTPQLAASYGPGHSVVLPNCVPARYLDVPHVDSDLVGWGGSVHSHPDDLQQVGSAIQQFVTGGGRFETVGAVEGVARALGLASDPGGPGPVDIDTWPSAIARFGIGVAPLADTRFNAAKSWLKALELNAVGVPCVASPRADYSAWADRSPGTILAPKPRVWLAMLRALAGDSPRRREMSEAGRDAARSFTIEGNAWRWAEAWEAAVLAQRAKVTAGAT